MLACCRGLGVAYCLKSVFSLVGGERSCKRVYLACHSHGKRWVAVLLGKIVWPSSHGVGVEESANYLRLNMFKWRLQSRFESAFLILLICDSTSLQRVALRLIYVVNLPVKPVLNLRLPMILVAAFWNCVLGHCLMGCVYSFVQLTAVYGRVDFAYNCIRFVVGNALDWGGSCVVFFPQVKAVSKLSLAVINDPPVNAVI